MQKIFPFLAILLFFSSFSQAQTADGFKKLENGLEIKMLVDKPGITANVDFISKIHVSFKLADSVIFDSRSTPNGMAISQPISSPKVLADLMLGFMQLSKGDKAIFRAQADALFQSGQEKPPFVNDGDLVTWEIEMVDLKSPQQVENELKELLVEENKILSQYCKTNNIKAKKTTSGLYLEIIEDGSGELVGTGRQASMNYTGFLLDGTTFDSNVDPKFQHVKPFEFVVGKGMVIKGWDEAIATLKVGSKAKIIIPSPLGYGTQAIPGNDVNPKGIPANSPLVFEVEVLGVKDAPEETPYELN